MSEQVAVVIEEYVQIWMEEYRMKRFSRNFAVTRSIKDMITWANSIGIKNATVNDLVFYDYTGSSV